MSFITVEKMKLIDKEYENLNYSGDKWFPLQSKLAAYRKEVEAQMQTEMNTKVCDLYFYSILFFSQKWSCTLQYLQWQS